MDEEKKLLFHNLNEKKSQLIIVILLIILSGFLLFNQISFIREIYDETKIGTTKVNLFMKLGKFVNLLRCPYFRIN